MSEAKIEFKSVSRKRKQFRRRRHSSEDEDTPAAAEGEEAVQSILAETLELQKLRQRSSGLSALRLASGQRLTRVEEAMAQSHDHDPFKIQSGGLLDLTRARLAQAIENGESEAVVSGKNADLMVGTQFSKETRIRDEDEEMQKFIESEMERRRGQGEDAEAQGQQYLSPEDRALLSLPEKLRKSTFSKKEDMLSSQMLSGIPEVDLGIEEKIRNIEATEAAKHQVGSRGDGTGQPSAFVPANLAVNFKQPNRFKIDAEAGPSASKKAKAEAAASQVVTQRTVVVGDVPEEKVITLPSDHAHGGGSGRPDHATDDLHVSKFKQHFQRK
eukprot:snap_masked-scaffold25_size650667-processed-gene-0.11 protein:Tk06683 transcript:snap_masked-scaffold25_size650667-processed-gene-0.11-mRNA-1 annotation:"hypothetical protein DAPPUDRAFT_305639"